jgi:hypothetical protein
VLGGTRQRRHSKTEHSSAQGVPARRLVLPCQCCVLCCVQPSEGACPPGALACRSFENDHFVANEGDIVYYQKDARLS